MKFWCALFAQGYAAQISRVFLPKGHTIILSSSGHEFSGHVEACGADVKDLRAGDAVACIPLLPCFSCPECGQGYYSLCKQYQFVGSRSDGGNAEYIVVKRANLFRLPAEMAIEDGAFIEPATVGLHAFHLASGCKGKMSLSSERGRSVCWRCSARWRSGQRA